MDIICIKYVAATVRAGGSETDRGGLMRQEVFPGRRACEARTELEDGSR
jgi:hypothetical protein